MAYVKSIWFHSTQLKNKTMRVNVQLKPAGEVSIDVPIPEDLHYCVLALASAAADQHEQLMKAAILAVDYNDKASKNGE